MKSKSYNYPLALLFVIMSTSFAYAQNTITVYYDSEWKGVQAKDFAYHELVYASSQDPHYRSRFVLRYASGEKEGEGEFVSIDKYDFTKSVLGSYKMYYKNGNKLVEYKLDENKMEYTSYYSNGLIEDKQTYTDGQLDGISYHFTEDGTGCFQTLYKNGQVALPYYTYSNKDGYVTKYKIKDNKIFVQTPTISEKKTYQSGNLTYEYYSKNGIIISVSCYYGQDYKETGFMGYGKYIMANVIFKNNTNSPILFDPNTITASIIRKGNRTAARLVNKSEYMGQVNLVTSFQSWVKAENEMKAANAAAYSYSVSNTNTYYSGSSTTGTVGAAVGAAVGTGGAAIGAAVGASLSKTAYSGKISSSTATVSYNGAAAYQAGLIAEQRIKDYNQQLILDRKNAESTYISKSIVRPGQTISGRILFDYEKADDIEVRIPISGVIYTF